MLIIFFLVKEVVGQKQKEMIFVRAIFLVLRKTFVEKDFKRQGLEIM